MILQRMNMVLALSFCLVLISNEAFAGQRRARRHRTTPARSSVQCLAAAAAGEAGGHGEQAQINVMKTILNRYGQGYGSSICSIIYARKQFAPRPSRVTPRILALAQQTLRQGLPNPNRTATHFHSYRNRYDRRAPWARNFSYLGFDGAHHLFVASSNVGGNARLASLNQQNFNQEFPGASGFGTTIMADNSHHQSTNLWATTSL